MTASPETDLAQEIENAISELSGYYDAVGLLFARARLKSRIYRGAITGLSISTTFLSVLGLVLLTLHVDSPDIGLVLAIIGLMVSILLIISTQLELSESDGSKALNYLQIREDASKLASQFKIEWATLRHLNADMASDPVRNFVTTLLTAKQDIAIRAHAIGIPKPPGN